MNAQALKLPPVVPLLQRDPVIGEPYEHIDGDQLIPYAVYRPVECPICHGHEGNIDCKMCCGSGKTPGGIVCRYPEDNPLCNLKLVWGFNAFLNQFKRVSP